METLPLELILDIYDIYKAGLKQRCFQHKVKLLEKYLKFPFIIFRHNGRYFFRREEHRWRVEYERMLNHNYVRIYVHSYHMETNREEFILPLNLLLYQ